MATPVDLTCRSDIEQYLTLLFPDAPDDAWLVVSWLAAPGDFRSQWFLASDRADAAHRLLELAPHCNTYVGLGLRHPQCTPDPQHRGTSADVLAIGGLWIECDHNAGVHAARNLPTPRQLRTFLDSLPCTFSLLIDSGGGIHGYLLFKEVWILDTPEEQHKAAHLLRQFQRTIQLAATPHGWSIDSTADLARVLRPPGTINHKGATPRPVRVVKTTPSRYNPSDLAEAPWLSDLEDMDTAAPHAHNSGHFPPTSLDPIAAGCAWLAHCRDDATTLTEPDWYAMLGIVGRCQDGHRLAHAWSAPYPRYSAGATDKKLAHALDDAGPRTCKAIRYDLNADAYCRQCAHWGTVKSPIRLGMPAPLELNLGDTPAHLGFQTRNGTAPPVVPTMTPLDPEEQTAWYQEEVMPYRNKKGIVDTHDTTIWAFLRNHSFWQGKLWWDDLANKPMYEQQELSDHLVTKLGALFGSKHKVPIRNDRMFARCLTACCYEHRHDPLQDYLDHIPGWDGVPRLDSWLMDCAGVVSTAYTRFLSRMLPVSMIARAYHPGCLYRYVIVFEGPEEFRKSSFVAALVPQKRWHLSLTSSFESKDVPMLIQGVWVAELTELDSLSRTQDTRLRSFISDTEDAYVPKWALFRVTPKRRTIFVGTTNESDWLKSATGNTRFFPVRILHPMDVELFSDMREQLYAEAKVWYYDHQDDWWSIPPEASTQAKDEREERRQASIYESDLAVWLDKGRFALAQQSPSIDPIPNETTWLEIATGFLRMERPEQWKDMVLQKQVAHALKALGWHQKPVWRGGKTVRVWLYEPQTPF